MWTVKTLFSSSFIFTPDFMLVCLLNCNFYFPFPTLSNLNAIVFFHAAHQVSSAGSYGESGLAGQTDL